ncbi:hypothetical protein AJ80_00441 [Polytolypa hystricis UAMH7299]|uniref:Uncharacterized protein n=1 Tax=Polytolypa hystricis (strain UAMH7299) TaxID=1447883 RepID=A0A2B7Z3F4_POLH7|nr:hypothetical protein AJ80_00441 [Polytolypa hystricis UAMH7299]
MSSSALQCNICPKKPNFSDTSHLLTHVSSKGHLSHYFKLQVRSHQEPEAGELLESYDQWYRQHNLAALLSERMLTKEAKRGRGQNRATLDSTASRSKSTRTGINSAPKAAKQENRMPDFLDPRLAEPYFPPSGHDYMSKRPRISEPITALSPPSIPQPQSWQPEAQSRRYLPSRAAKTNGWKVEPQDDSDDEETSPLVRRKMGLLDRARASNPYRRPRCPVTPDPFVDNPGPDYALDDDEEGEVGAGGGEMTKLKGVLWPGMDIFDSATEQMRRKRNQKKDGSILKQMEKTSENVEPTEMVFSPGGTLRKERLISGMVDDSSPLQGETPIPKRRATRPKRPSSQSVPTMGNLRIHGRRDMKGGDRRHTMSLEELSRRALPLLDSPSMNHTLHYFGNHYVVGDPDFNLTFADVEQKHQRGFAVFGDTKMQPQPTLGDLLPREEESGANRMGLDLNSRHTFMGRNSFPQFHQTQSFDKVQPSLPKARHANRSVGKENLEPALANNDRVEQHSGHSEWPTHPQASIDGRHSSQYFYSPSLGGFSDNAFGYSSNPLSYSFQHLQNATDQMDGSFSRVHSLGTASDHKPVKTERTISPDGTVSDLDGDELGRMYLDSLTA